MAPDRYKDWGLLIQATYRAAEAGLAGETPGLRITIVNGEALSQWQILWEPLLVPDAPGADWKWPEIVSTHRKKYGLAHFEAAFWRDGILGGLMVGRVAGGAAKRVLVLYLQGNPDDGHPLKGQVAVIADATAMAYATAVAAKEVRIEDPLEGTEPIYEGLGYRLVETSKGERYLRKEVVVR